MSTRACLLLIALALSCHRAKNPPPGSPAGAPLPVAVERGDLELREVLTGELDAVNSDALTVPQTSVWNLSIRWIEEEGTPVKAGQRLVEFDNSELTSDLDNRKLAVQQATGDLISQTAGNAIEVADREIEVERKRTALEKAQLQAAVPADSYARRVYQENQLALERAKAAHEKALDELASKKKAALLDVQVRQVALDKVKREVASAESAISALVLTAPRDGLLIIAEHPWQRRKMQLSDVVQPGMTVVKIPDLSAMQVRATMSDVDEGRVAVGMKTICRLDGYPDFEFPGMVKYVSAVAEQPENNALRRSFRVIVSLDRTDVAKMRPGMSVKVEVRGSPSEGKIIVPRQAIEWTGDKARARLASGQLAPLELGPCDAQRCAAEGIAQGAILSGKGAIR